MTGAAKRLRGGKSLSPGAPYWLRYILPGLIVYVVFMAWPLLDSIRMSLYTSDAGQQVFTGLDNYTRLFSGGTITTRFWSAFGHTWYFFLIHMLAQNLLGILFATMLTNPTMRGRQLYQTIIFLPTTLAVLVTGYLWKLMLNPLWTRDILNAAGLGALVRPWLGESSTALTVVSLVSCWQWMGIPTMMFVAALRNVPEELLESASIEGANSWHQFRHIKLPLILPVVGMIAILTFVNNFNAFDVIFSMEGANGPPGYATDLIGTLFYRTGIAGEHPIGIADPGLGSAIATVTFLMLACGVIPTLRLTQTKE